MARRQQKMFDHIRLSDLMRPTDLGDLLLPPETITRLQEMQNSGRIMNLVFHGPPGLGKTSAANILAAPHQKSSMTITGAWLKGSDAIVQLESFASTHGVFFGKRICLIDDADTMPKSAQLALRRLIDTYPHAI